MQVAQAIAERALRLRGEITAARDKALVHNIGVSVANALARVMR